MIVSMVAVVVIGVPFVIWWWKLADRWADAESRRFKNKPGGPGHDDAVVIKDFGRDEH